jgi:hypothetical protein
MCIQSKSYNREFLMKRILNFEIIKIKKIVIFFELISNDQSMCIQSNPYNCEFSMKRIRFYCKF